ncbi:GPR1/FUN34/yaaH family-domain-containing protein, partial [Abortiporus biennis]
YRRRIGNPGPLGLFSFASTTFILSLYNVQARGITHPNVVVGMALGVGGLAQLLAGMWEFACGNTFGATAFSSYGGFWLSYAALFIPGSGILDAYADHGELASALGIYLITWAMVTFLLLIGATRRNAGLIALFAFLTITFILLAAGEFSGHVGVSKAGGAVGIATAMIAYYVGLAELMIRDESWFTMPVGQIPKR